MQKIDNKECEDIQALEFDKISLIELEEIEEVVTPSDGTYNCC